MKEAYEDGSHSAINWDTEINRCITTRIMRKGGKMEGNKFKVGDLVKHRSGWFGCVMDVELIQSIRLGPVPVARLTVSPLPNQGFSWRSCVTYEGEFTRVEGTVKKPDEPRFKPGDRVWFAGTVVKWFSPVNGHSCAEVNLDGGADGHPTLITESEMARAQPEFTTKSTIDEAERLKSRLATADLVIKDLRNDIGTERSLREEYGRELIELRKKNARPWTVDDLNENMSLRTQLEELRHTIAFQRGLLLSQDDLNVLHNEARAEERERIFRKFISLSTCSLNKFVNLLSVCNASGRIFRAILFDEQQMSDFLKEE
jgi:hypothetical protein